MAQLPPGRPWTPTAENFVQHQLDQVTNFWRLGLAAEFHLVSQGNGTAELRLAFPLHAPYHPIPPPPPCPPNPAESGTVCLKKASRSRILRRERRAAKRAAAEKDAAVKADAENAAAMKAVNAEITAAKKTIDLSSDGNCLDGEIDNGASTSCVVSQCWNCDAAMSADHQCDSEVPPTPPSITQPCKVTVKHLPPPFQLLEYQMGMVGGQI